MFNKQQDDRDNPSPGEVADEVATAEQLADGVQRWGMSAPATIVLALGRPLGFFGAQLLYVSSPILRLFDFALGTKLATRANTIARLLENPAALEHLNSRLEQGAASFTASQPPPAGEER